MRMKGKASEQQRDGSVKQRDPMKLYLVFAWGFLASLAVVGGTTYLFAAYETASWRPLAADPPLTQDKWFEILRNAVTAAAALGVGVTLFFSYRRQQTAEETQRIGAEAQRTAAKAQETAAAALELANKQHDLEQSRRLDALSLSLRDRYSKMAEQLASSHLAVRLAGIYSLAALADDWAKNGNLNERQVCLDLMCAYFRSQPDENPTVRKELVDATFQVVAQRLKSDSHGSEQWGTTRLRLVDPGFLPSTLGPFTVGEGGDVHIVRGRINGTTRVRKLELTSGNFGISEILNWRGPLMFTDPHLSGDAFIYVSRSTSRRLATEAKDGPAVKPPPPQNTLMFRKLQLDGGSVVVNASGTHVIFTECIFTEGTLSLTVDGSTTEGGRRTGKVSFRDCVFRTDVFEDRDWEPDNLLSSLSTDVLAVDAKCRFENGATVLEPFDKTEKLRQS